jgi:hypothetical protein
MLLAVGLIWLFVLSMIIVRREEGALRWTTIKRRLHELGMTFLPLQIVLSEGKAAEGEEQL